jgi:hypothetical protein
MSSWNLTSDFDAVPPRARPSFVADLMNRLRSVSGPILSGLKGETGCEAVSTIVTPREACPRATQTGANAARRAVNR